MTTAAPRTARKAPAKRATGTKPASKGTTARRGRQAGVQNKATIRRKELETFMGRKLNAQEVQHVKDNPSISNEDFIEFVGVVDPQVQEAAGMVGGDIVGDEPELAEKAGAVTAAVNGFLDAVVREEAEASVRLHQGEIGTYSVDDGQARTAAALASGTFGGALVVIDETDEGQAEIRTENVVSISVVAIKRSEQAYENALSGIETLRKLPETALTRHTMRRLHDIAGAALGV